MSASHTSAQKKLSGKFRVQRGTSNKTSGPILSTGSKVIKRPRNLLVCNQCRKSKLRCDREFPCSSCTKRGEAVLCSFQHVIDGAGGDHGDSGHNSVAEDRLLHLEALVTKLVQNQTKVHSEQLTSVTNESLRNGDDNEDREDDAEDDETYVGATHWSAVLDDIHELKLTLNGSSHQRQVTSSPPDSHSRLVENDPIFGSSGSDSLSDLVENCLPPKIDVDRSIAMYFRGETYITPFIHMYQFQDQYREFWKDTLLVNPLWLSTLFSICCMTSMFSDSGDPACSPSDRMDSKAASLHETAGKCLVLGNYRRPQQFAVEALAMYGTCKNLRSLDPSREAGHVFSMAIRMAHEMGYHRRPEAVGSFNAFEAEMRRRCWAAIKQIDLMISFQLGLPSSVCLDNCDTRSPRNLSDSDFGPSTEVLPDSRPETQATGLLWFIVKDRLMINFAKVWQDALSFHSHSTEPEILKLDQEIHQKYDSTVPSVLRVKPLSESLMDPPFLVVTRMYLDFIHLKSLCVLHRRHMVQGSELSTKRCVEAGVRLVRQFIDMCKEFFEPGGQLCGEKWMLTNFTVNDFLLGVMVLCLFVHLSHRRQKGRTPIVSEEERKRKEKVLLLLEESLRICPDKLHGSNDATKVAEVIRFTLQHKHLAREKYGNGLSITTSELHTPATVLHSSDSIVRDLDMHGEDPSGNFGMFEPLSFVDDQISSLEWMGPDLASWNFDVSDAMNGLD